MFGHKWEPAHGTITGVEPDPRHHELVYVVEVPMDGGGGLQARIRPPRSMGPDLPPGTQVKVEVNAKNGEVRFAADAVEGFSPGQIESPAAPGGLGGPDWTGGGAPGSVNVTVNLAQSGAGAIGDVAEIVSRLGGAAAGNAVAAALANLGSGLTGGPGQPGQSGQPGQPGQPEQPGQPRQPGPAQTTEVHVTGGSPEVRVVSGAEAAEFMREFFGPAGPTADRPASEA